MTNSPTMFQVQNHDPDSVPLDLASADLASKFISVDSGCGNSAERPLAILQTLHLVCDRFSHSFRTHLGVSLGVVEDHLAGLPLTLQDFQDADRALRSILATLDAMRDIGSSPLFEPKRGVMSQLIKTAQRESFGLRLSCEILTATAGNASLLLDERLFLRALRCLLQFASRAILKAEAPARVALTVSSTLENQSLLITFPIPTSPRLVAGVVSLGWLAKTDQTPEALGLLFAEEVFRLHHASSLATIQDGSIELSVRFPE